MSKEERENFINLIYNDYLNNFEGLTKLIKDTHDGIETIP